MKRTVWLVSCGVVVMLLGLTGAALALPFEVVHDYASLVIPYQGHSYVVLTDIGNAFDFFDTFTLDPLSPAGDHIDSAFLSVTHVGNHSGLLNAELWVLTENGSGFAIGAFSDSGSPLFDSPWKTDTFELSTEVIDLITGSHPWKLAVKLSEETNLVDIIWVDRAALRGEYTAVPEPATLLLLGAGLVGMAGFARRKYRI
jgi:hypothetical protein